MKLKAFALITLIAYAAGCFSWTSLNPADWNEFGRVVIATTWAIISMLMVIAWTAVFDDDTDEK